MATRRSRRDFLGKTAGVAAMAGVWPRVAFGASDGDDAPIVQARGRAPLAAGEPVRIGVIGTGGMGTGHVQAFSRFAKEQPTAVRVEALCDVCQPRVEAAKKIVETVLRTQATVRGPIPLPTENHRFTVIRGPHKDKDSREHFEMRIHKRLLDILEPSPKTVDSLQRIELPAGVDIEIKIQQV